MIIIALQIMKHYNMKKIITYLLFITFSLMLNSQNTEEPFILIPEVFDAFDKPNQYNLNNLALLAMEKQNIPVFHSIKKAIDLPMDCNFLKMELIADHTFFYKKVTIIFKNCKGETVLSSNEGRSREKEFKLGYNMAFRDAEKSINYTTLKEILYNIKKPQTISIKSNEEVSINDYDTLYAQPIENGFQLIDATPKVVYKIYYTSQKEIFTAIKNDQQGILLKNNNQWFFEYTKDGEIKKESVNIKF